MGSTGAGTRGRTTSLHSPAAPASTSSSSSSRAAAASSSSSHSATTQSSPKATGLSSPPGSTHRPRLRSEASPAHEAANGSGATGRATRSRGESAAESLSSPAASLPSSNGASSAGGPVYAMDIGPRDGSDPPLPFCLSRTDVQASARVYPFLRSLDEWQDEMWQVLRKLLDDPVNAERVFSEPVDDTYLPEYYTLIKRPMDLGSVMTRLEDGFYESHRDFAADVRLVFSNAQLFNFAGHPVHEGAKKLAGLFEKLYPEAAARVEASLAAASAHTCKICRGNTCALCGGGCLEFKTPQLRCSFPCKSKIARKANYWRWGGERGQHWCQKCYSGLPEDFTGILGQKLTKKELEKCVNEEHYMEPWVDCASCKKPYHQICALYVAPRNNAALAAAAGPQRPAGHTCASCALKSPPVPVAPPKQLCAAHLPKTLMSSFIEKRVRQVAAADLAKPLPNPGHAATRTPLSPAEAQAVASSLTIRVLSDVKDPGNLEPRLARWQELQARAVGRARVDRPPQGFPHRQKAISMWQKREGVDVLVFVLYVQEYGADCPPPNRGCVYVSYLDSVAFVHPRHLRTPVYQEIVSAYLCWAMMRGFKHAHIWACPPQRGDAYVMYGKPKWQRTPSADRLRKWYGEIVKACRDQGVVVAETNLLEAQMSNFRPLVHTRRRAVVQAATGKSSPPSSPTAAPTKLPDRPLPDSKFQLESIPYFSGDFVQTELEVVLTQLEVVTSDLAEAIVRHWWINTWGPKSSVEIVPCMYVSPSSHLLAPATRHPPHNEATTSALAAAQWEAFSSQGIPRPPVTWTVKASVGDVPDALLARLEANCTAKERDDWIVRRVAAAVRPLKDNFLVLRLSSPFEDLHGASAASATPSKKRVKLDASAAKSPNGASVASPAFDSRVEPTVYIPVRHDLSDPDVTLTDTVFARRLALLDLLQHFHLQFDQLRRAKHSSLVLLECLAQSFAGAGLMR